MKFVLYLLLICVVVAGSLGLWIFLTSEPPPPNTLLVNNNSVADFRERPPTFQKINDHLFRKQLAGEDVGSGFTKVDCGINFKNFFDRTRPMELLDTGSGVAIGDYDNDGLADIYLVGADVSNRLYRNLGNFQFEDVTEFAGVNGQFQNKNLFGSGATFADIDNDGDLDLYVCNMSSPNLLYVNQGDGTFREQGFVRNVAHVGASKCANFCDYDRDGDLDFYLATYQDRYPDRSVDPVVEVNGKKQIHEEFREQFSIANGIVLKAGQKDFLFRNDGNGVFEDVTEDAGLTDYGTTLAAVWFDYDGDGWQDIYASNDFHAPDRLFRNNHDGTFNDVLPKVVKHTPWFSMGNDAGDLNNDGFDDLITADMSGTTHYRRKVDMGDMGDSSFFLTWGKPRQYMRNSLFINSGAGKFFEIASLAGMSSTDWTWSTRMVDMDNDGRLDIFVTNGHARDIMNADTTAEIERLTKLGNKQAEVDQLYVSIPARKETNFAFRNLGNLNFESTGKDWALDHLGISHGAAFSDLDGDGDLDLVINNYDENAIVYRNDSNSQQSTLFELRCDRNNFFGVGTRMEVWQNGFYQSKTLRSARGYLSSDAPALHFGFPTTSKIDRLVITWPDGTQQEHKAIDVGHKYRVIEDGSGKPAPKPSPAKTMFADVSAAKKLTFKHTETPFDDFKREPLLPYKLSELGAAVAWNDVNDDGFPDLFCGGAGGQAGKLFISNKGQSFESVDGPWGQHSAAEDMGLLFFDADSDGDDDLYVVSGSNECEAGDTKLNDRLYLNIGGGKFESAPAGSLPSMNHSGSCVCAADFDRDGDLDLFVGSRAIAGKYPETPQSKILLNENGTFKDATENAANGLADVGLVNSATWADYDNDGWIDLIIALDWGPVTFFKNENGVLRNQTEKLGVSNFKGWWRGISIADLDDDGDLDLIVTNQGTNTKYHTDVDHPHRIYYSDFDNSGTLDLVESEYEGDVEYPARGLSCSSRSMPFIKDEFKTYHEFASAPLADIYSTKEKSIPFREVNFLRSAIFWNQTFDGKSGFKVEPLPIEAQFSPAFGLTVGDFDNDSIQDIFLANNFFASQPETGFMDGGLSLLLRGRGDRKFEAVWPNESGIAIDVASYGAAAADFDRDGDIDIAVATNNDHVRLLENQSSITADSSVRITLVGKTPANVAHGARVLLEGDQFTRAYSIGGGGNYLSQSENTLCINRKVLEKSKTISVFWPDGSQSKTPIGSLTDSEFIIRQDANQ